MHCDQVSKFFAFKERHEKMISSYTVSESKTSTGHGIAKVDEQWLMAFRAIKLIFLLNRKHFHHYKIESICIAIGQSFALQSGKNHHSLSVFYNQTSIFKRLQHI